MITAAAVSPTAVDVTSGPVNVTATITITDDDSGFLSGNLYLYNPSGDYVRNVYFTGANRISGNAHDGVYQFTLTVPEYGAPGTWRIDALVTDQASNTRYYNPHPEGNSFPVPGDMVITVTNTGTVDAEPPALTSSSVSPNPADVSAGPVTLTFTLTVDDAISGCDYGFIYPRDPTFNILNDSITYFSDFSRISGDENSGTYEVQITLPQGSMTGDWTFLVYLHDSVGNYVFEEGSTFTIISNPPPTSDAAFLSHALDAVHLPFTTTGTGWFITSDDTNDGIDSASPAPVPDGASSSMSTTVTGPGTLRFHWRVSSEEFDDFLSVAIPSASIYQEISGDTLWEEQVLTLPAGTHEVTWSYTKGPSGSSYQDSAWVDQVRFTADAVDSELPRLQALRISPGRINQASPDDLTIEMEITDDFLGCNSGWVYLIGPSGNIEDSQYFDLFNQVSGDDLAGSYQVSFPGAVFSDPGLWRVEIVLIEQITSLSRSYEIAGDAYPLVGTDQFYVGDEPPSDSQGPVLRKLEIYPQIADVSYGDAPVMITLHATDLHSGVQTGFVSIVNPNNGWTGDFYLTRITGDDFNGIYRAEAVSPVYGIEGTWSVRVQLWDQDFNYTDHPYSSPFPSGIDPSYVVVNTVDEDTELPFLTTISISPTSIDTSAAPANILVTLEMGDLLSGILDAYAYFYDPNNQFRSELITVLKNEFSNVRISGDDWSGTYQFTKTLPTGSMTGDWRIEIFVRDRTGQIRILGTNSDPYPSGSGVFTVSGAISNWFASKMAFYSLTGADALPGADPDNDGKSNAEEAAAGSNPALADGASFATIQRTATHVYLVFQLSAALTVGTSGDYLTLSESGMSPLRLTGEIQNGLSGTWTKVLPELVSGSTWRVGIPLASGTNGFVRLRFENP